MLTMEFLVTSLVVVIIPGTGVIYTLSNGLFAGWRASIAAAIGCTAGILPHLMASILGLSAVLHMSALVFQAFKYAGAAYLLYLAWGMWRDTGSLRLDQPVAAIGWRAIVTRGFLINILNPKLSIFFLAFLPLFVSTEAAYPAMQMAVLSAVFMVLTLIIFILYGLAAHGVRRFIVNAPEGVIWVQRTFAATFAALGVRLALSDR